MKPGLRVAIFGGGLLLVFVAALAVGAFLIPESVVEGWLSNSGGH